MFVKCSCKFVVEEFVYFSVIRPVIFSVIDYDLKSCVQKAAIRLVYERNAIAKCVSNFVSCLLYNAQDFH